MAVKVPKLDYKDLMETIPDKPSLWKVKQMKSFLEFVNFKNCVEKFEEQKITGKKFLDMDDKSGIWIEMNLTNKAEKSLQEYRKQLLAYEKNFSTNKKEETGGFQGVNKVQEQLQKVFNKNLKIEKSEYVVEEEEEKKPPNKNVMNKVVNKQPKFPSSYEKQKRENNMKNNRNDSDDNSSDDDDAEKTRKKGKPPKKIVEPEDEDETINVKLNKKPKEKPKIILTHLKEDWKTYTYTESFTISRILRNKKMDQNIYVDDKQASRNHINVILIEKKGFFIQDLGSSNHTFIKIDEECNIVIEKNMEFVMGSSILKVLMLEGNKIKFNVIVDFEGDNPREMEFELKISSNCEEPLCFGKKPGKYKNSYLFEKDPKMEKEQVLFSKNNEKFIMKILPSAEGVWLQLGNEKNSSDFYLLHENMLLRIGENRFLINKTYSEKWALCDCKASVTNSVYEPCGHSLVCYECAVKKTTCKVCKDEVLIRKINDLYQKI